MNCRKEKNIKVGIGFATGRKTFQRVLRNQHLQLAGIRFGGKHKNQSKYFLWHMILIIIKPKTTDYTNIKTQTWSRRSRAVHLLQANAIKEEIGLFNSGKTSSL